MVLDREKTGAFIKTTRQEKNIVHFVDGEAIREIKQLSQSLGREALPAPEDETVEAEFSVVDDDETEEEDEEESEDGN